MLKLLRARRRKGRVDNLSLKSLEQRKVLMCCSSVLPRFKKARELQDAKEAAKEREALDKVSRAEARTSSKAQKDLEAQKKREDRA
jgi:hypothetical protein